MNKEVNNKQNRKVTIFALFLSLASVAVLVFGFLLVSSNKVILLQSISNIYNKINVFKNNDMTLINKLSSNKNTGFKTTVEIAKEDDKLVFDLNYLENSESNKMRLDLVINYLEEELLNSNIVLEDNRIYMFFKDITTNYYYTNYNYKSLNKVLPSSDYSRLLEIFKDSVDKIINNDDITKDRATVKYNGKDKKVNKLSYKIGYKEIREVLDNFVKELQNDKKLYKNIASSLEITTKELTNELESLKELVPNSDKEIIEYSVYYYGFNKIFRYELHLLDSNTMISYQENKDDYVITLNMMDTELFKLVVTKNKGLYDYELVVVNPLDSKEYTITGTYQKNKLTVKYNDVETVLDTSVLEKDNNYITNGSILVKDEDSELLSIKYNTTYYFDEEVKFNDVNSINISDLTQEDIDLIVNNIKENKIYKFLSSIDGINKYIDLEELK